MNCRIAYKILKCASTLCTNPESVITARQVLRDNPQYFKKKGMMLFPENDMDIPLIRKFLESKEKIKCSRLS